jgi:TolA-binding protein
MSRRFVARNTFNDKMKDWHFFAEKHTGPHPQQFRDQLKDMNDDIRQSKNRLVLEELQEKERIQQSKRRTCK